MKPICLLHLSISRVLAHKLITDAPEALLPHIFSEWQLDRGAMHKTPP